MTVYRLLIVFIVHSPTETLPKKKQQSRQIQAAHTPSFPQHAGWRPAPASPSTRLASDIIPGSSTAATAAAAAVLAAIDQ